MAEHKLLELDELQPIPESEFGNYSAIEDGAPLKEIPESELGEELVPDVFNDYSHMQGNFKTIGDQNYYVATPHHFDAWDELGGIGAIEYGARWQTLFESVPFLNAVDLVEPGTLLCCDNRVPTYITHSSVIIPFKNIGDFT